MNEPTTPETDEAERLGSDKGCWVRAEFARKLERERDEAREKYTTLLTENMFSVHQLCKERDEAIAKIERQKARIRYLEGATNHATGTPLSIAIKECNEAREVASGLAKQAERLRKERDEAREQMADSLQEVDLRTLDYLRMREAIIATLEENRHLAGGDDCTLAKLKSVVPEWK